MTDRPAEPQKGDSEKLERMLPKKHFKELQRAIEDKKKMDAKAAEARGENLTSLNVPPPTKEDTKKTAEFLKIDEPPIEPLAEQHSANFDTSGIQASILDAQPTAPIKETPAPIKFFDKLKGIFNRKK